MYISNTNETFDKKEENILFNDTLNTFYIWLYYLEHMVKEHSDSERGNPLPPLNGLLILISSKFFFYMQHPTDRIAHIIAFVTPVVDHWLEREIIQWFQHDGFHKKVLRAVLKNKYIKQIIHVGDS